MIELIIPGKPNAKKRPKFARRGERTVTYSDQKAEQDSVRYIIKSQLKNHKLFEGAIYLEAVFYMPIPKSTPKKKKVLMMSGKIYHVKKPDKDNLEKFICDCLNGIVWRDDAQVAHSESLKVYSGNPRTELTIKQIDVLA